MEAVVKYIINPVTSTSVATNGAEAVAGSNPTFFKRIGIIEPESVPHITIKINETDTLKPIHNQYSP